MDHNTGQNMDNINKSINPLSTVSDPLDLRKRFWAILTFDVFYVVYYLSVFERIKQQITNNKQAISFQAL